MRSLWKYNRCHVLTSPRTENFYIPSFGYIPRNICRIFSGHVLPKIFSWYRCLCSHHSVGCNLKIGIYVVYYYSVCYRVISGEEIPALTGARTRYILFLVAFSGVIYSGFSCAISSNDASLGIWMHRENGLCVMWIERQIHNRKLRKQVFFFYFWPWLYMTWHGL